MAETEIGNAGGGLDRPEVAAAWAFFERMGAGDIDGAFALVHDDATWWINGFRTVLPKDDFRALVERIVAYSPISFTLTRAVVDGDTVAIEAEGRGPTPDGRGYDNVYAFFVELRDGRIAAVREHADTFYGADRFPQHVLFGTLE
jgi:ketosteroid isomerase-like protein